MAHQPDANATLCSTATTPSPATNMLIDSDHPYSVPKKGKQKGTTTHLTHTIPSFFQRRPLPSPPTTVATAVGTDHPDAPPTKKRISTTTPTNEKGSANNSTMTPQTPPEADFSSCWLRIDLPMPTPNTSQYSHKDILLALQTFAFAAWQIDPFLSFLPTFEASKYPPLINNSNFPTYVHTFKHYLKNSTIASLL